MEEIIYLEFNNWFGGRDYPEIPNIEDWVGQVDVPDYDSPLLDNEWCKEQRICVRLEYIDMSINFCITAPKSWVEKNCPKCLTNDEYTEEFIVGNEKRVYRYSYDRFRREPEDGETIVMGKFGCPFLEYTEENFGCSWYDRIEIEEDDE